MGSDKGDFGLGFWPLWSGLASWRHWQNLGHGRASATTAAMLPERVAAYRDLGDLDLRWARLGGHPSALLGKHLRGIAEILQPSALKVSGVVEPLDTSDTPSATTRKPRTLQGSLHPRDAAVDGFDHLAFQEAKHPPPRSFECQCLAPVPLDIFCELL